MSFLYSKHQTWVEFCCQCTGHLYHDRTDVTIVGESCTWFSSYYCFLRWNVHNSIDWRFAGAWFSILFISCLPFAVQQYFVEFLTILSCCSLAMAILMGWNSMLETSEFRLGKIGCFLISLGSTDISLCQIFFPSIFPLTYILKCWLDSHEYNGSRFMGTRGSSTLSWEGFKRIP